MLTPKVLDVIDLSETLDEIQEILKSFDLGAVSEDARRFLMKSQEFVEGARLWVAETKNSDLISIDGWHVSERLANAKHYLMVMKSGVLK